VETELKSFARAVSEKRFSITAEIPLRGHTPADEVLMRAKEIAPYVDAVQLAQNPQQQGQMSVVALASLLLGEGIDPVTRLNCRDRNRHALQGDLLGLRALGVSSLILNQGNRLHAPDALIGNPVFDINCGTLISMAAEIGEESYYGAGHEFVIGTSATVFPPRPDWKASSLIKRAKAGARFLQTQPCLNVDLLRRYLEHLVSLQLTWQYAVVVTLAPLPGIEWASWQLEDPRGTVVPKKIVDELTSSPDQEQAGIEICARQMREIADIPGVCGINLMTLGNPSAVQAAIELSGLRNPD
jgi:methylenetetrahydrofolate reductase (NADPH)